MRINLFYQQEPLVIETDHNDPDEAIAIEYIGSGSAIAAFITETSSGKYGHYGHIFNLDSTTNLDLQKVVYDLKGFKVLSVEPRIKARSLPTGTVT